MINYLSSNLSVSIYQFHYTELNSINTKNFIWNGGLIVYGAFYNYTNGNFSNLDLLDASATHILHTAPTDAGCYTIAFSGTNSGAPLNTAAISSMNGIIFDWNLNLAPTTGSLMVKLYYI